MADLARNRVRDRLLGRKIDLTSVELTLCWPSSGRVLRCDIDHAAAVFNCSELKREIAGAVLVPEG